jgi:copper homeostasis protein
MLEIAVFSAQGAIIASKALADRLELCSGYAEGGLTPSLGTIRFVKENAKCPVCVMIRPRGGNFSYSDSEIEVMKRDIAYCKETGVNGIVFGILKQDFSIDEKTVTELVKLASPLPVTFHRAFDICYEPFMAMETLINCGVKRILTSGQKSTAQEGAKFISDLNKKANGRMIIMPGAGINPGNIADLARETNCTEFHASAKRISSSADVFGFGENVLPHPEIIRQLKERLYL